MKRNRIIIYSTCGRDDLNGYLGYLLSNYTKSE